MSEITSVKRPEQVLGLDPKTELHFKGPFTEVVTTYLKLVNPSDSRVCFRMRTMAPKRYCARPNKGIVEPKTTTIVAVKLHPFDLRNLAEKYDQNLVVQTKLAPEEDVDLHNLWRKTPPEEVMESRLQCVFDHPSGGPGPGTVSSRARGTGHTDAPYKTMALTFF